MKSLRYISKYSLLNNLRIYPNIHRAQLSSHSKEVLKKRTDFEELFLNKNVRYILKRLTGYDPSIVFSSKSLDNLRSPKYRFMTDEQLNIEREAADKRAEELLKMPPVKYSCNPEPKIFEKDTALKGFLNNKMIFVDATPGYSDQERLIVVREIDGTLREATRDERHRMNQVFYPLEERHMDPPKMLEPEHIEPVLKRGAYKMLLGNACLHFEPDDERFLDICHRIYDHISENDAFDSLYSTRYYGGMVYYYVFFRCSDKLLLHLLQNQKLDEVYHLLQLYYIINSRSGVPIEFQDYDSELSLTVLKKMSSENQISVPLEQIIGLLKFYIDNDSTNSQVKAKLELALQKIESQNKKKNANEN